jgi:hypothetical protein
MVETKFAQGERRLIFKSNNAKYYLTLCIYSAIMDLQLSQRGKEHGKETGKASATENHWPPGFKNAGPDGGHRPD